MYKLLKIYSMIQNTNNSLVNNNFNFHANKVETGSLIIALAGVVMLFILYEDYQEKKRLKLLKLLNSKRLKYWKRG